jgi:hypothetical protein
VVSRVDQARLDKLLAEQTSSASTLPPARTVRGDVS